MKKIKKKEKGSVGKSDVSNLVNPYLKTKLATLATKAELKAEQDKIVNFKHLIQTIFVVKSILKIMAHRIFCCFSQILDISNKC